MMIEVPFELVHPNARPPLVATKGSSGWDLYLPDNVRIEVNEVKRVDLGFRMKIPDNWEGVIRPRSSLYKHGCVIANSPATIDSDYVGNVHVLLWACFDVDVHLQAGDRVAQLVFQTVPRVRWKLASLPETDRGSGGFGSTGR